MEYKGVEATGKPMRQFTTGSVRDNAEGKGRWDLLPFYPMLRLAQHYENGAKKYGDRNWEKGQPVHEFLNSAMRHLMRFIAGENGEDHLSAVAWNVFGAIHTIKQVELGNLPQELIEGLHPDHMDRIKNIRHDNLVDQKLSEIGTQIVEEQRKGASEILRDLEIKSTPATKVEIKQKPLTEEEVMNYMLKVDMDKFNHYITAYPLDWLIRNDIGLRVTLDTQEGQMMERID